jgi:hypothetical protein
MTRTTWLLLAFFVLGIIAVGYTYLNREDALMRGLKAERNFALKDLSRLRKIFIAQRDGETTLLEKKNGDWIYNQKHLARPNAIENLLDAIQRVEIDHIPAKAAVQNIVRNLAGEGIKVELYESGAKPIKTYYVGGGTSDERGVYMIMEGFDQPFVCHIPGWEGNLRYRYNLRGDDWRDKTVFAEDPEQIQSLSIEYPKQKNRSFTLERKGGSFVIQPFYSTTPLIRAAYREGSAEAFLIGFESLVAEAFENSTPAKDSVRQLVPFSIITLTNTRGKRTWAKLFPIFPDTDLALDPKTGQWVGADGLTVERYFVDHSSGDFMLIQDRVFRKVLRGYEYFWK